MASRQLKQLEAVFGTQRVDLAVRVAEAIKQDTLPAPAWELLALGVTRQVAAGERPSADLVAALLMTQHVPPD